MEVIEELSSLSSSIDNVKNSVITEETSTDCVEADVCHKSNGVVDECQAGPAAEDNVITETVITVEGDELLEENNDGTVINETESLVVTTVPEPEKLDLKDTVLSQDSHSNKNTNSNTEIINNVEPTVYQEIEMQVVDSVSDMNDKSSSVQVITEEDSSIKIDTEESSTGQLSLESSNKDKVRFKTEIVIEKNDHDVNENNLNDGNADEHATNNILSDLGQSIELSEVLQSSDVTDNAEHNNCTGRQEMFNKEELLDILQGKDVESNANQVGELEEIPTIDSKALEAQLAIQQLTRLKNSKRKKSMERIVKTPKKNEKKEEKKTDNIINVLVKDWDDEEIVETDKCSKLLKESDNLLKSVDELKEVQNAVTAKEELIRTSIDSATSEDQSQKSSKSGDEGQPQKRMGRIIKKKVIFDPDNPDTFTKGKIVTKSKESNVEKESPPNKKSKIEVSILRSKSKSPVSKLQWKKPTLKNSKQNKRLSEVDKLLMDEGAVNMIYQLTPEAPKGKKNVKTKAEFIKKIQSSTPDGKEMKFRERKKDSSKYEDGEAKKILGGKHRASLSSSVKSPSVCEDFETHSADDSIIYRRHSSSSYSSTCMSPRRLSDVESGGILKGNKTSDVDYDSQTKDAFTLNSVNVSNSEMINRDDCLSIKEKLKSKLSLALNKRKRDNSKIDKLPKQKKVKDSPKNDMEINFKYLTIDIDQRLAEITIYKESTYSIEVLKEVEQALHYVDSRNDISVTLLTSLCGTLCSSIDLRPLLDDDEKKRAINAYEIAESVRSLLSSVEQHGKLVCTGVWGACSGVALALVARSDVALGSERATFALHASPRQLALQPGLAALTAPCSAVHHSLVRELAVVGRRVSGAEAARGGLLARCEWAPRGRDSLRALAAHLAAQPAQNIMLKKQLMRIRKSGDYLSTFLSCLETERDLLVEYWTSVEGQELLRADHEPA